MRAWRGGWAAAAVAAGLVLLGCDDRGRAVLVVEGFRATPETLAFGPTALGGEAFQELLLENDGRAPFTVHAVRSSAASLRIAGADAPFTIGPGQKHTLRVTFAPAVEGELSGAVTVETDSPEAGEHGQAVIGAKGRGVRAFATVGVRTLDFGNVELGTAHVLKLPLANTTEAAVATRITLGGDDADQFTPGSNESIVLAPGQTVDATIAFNPRRLGAAAAIATVSICGACDPVQVELMGMGIASRLEITPMVVNFGRVKVGASGRQTVTVKNLGTTPFEYAGATVVSDASGAFRVARAPALPDNKLYAGQTVSIDLEFAPQALPAVRGLVQVNVREPGGTGPKLQLIGEGGASCVRLSPDVIDFGIVPFQMSATRYVEALNACADTVELSSFSTSTSAGGYFSLAGSTSFVSIPAGEKAWVGVVFTPKPNSTASAGELTLSVQQGGVPSTERIALKGTGELFTDCSYAVRPSSVAFHNVAVGAKVTRRIILENTGNTRCFLGEFKLASGSDGEFTTSPRASQVIEPGGQVYLDVAFQPKAERGYSAIAEATVNHATAARIAVPISGSGVSDCFTLEPAAVDFATTRLSCGPKDRTLLATNRCAGAVALSGLRLVSESGELTFVNAPALPLSIAANSVAALVVRYQPVDDGSDVAAIEADVTGRGTYTASARGLGSTKDEQTDRFVQQAQSKVDVLFVIDNSGSMMEEQESLGKNFAAFLTSAQAQGIDYQIATTTTGLETSTGGWSQCPGGAQGGEAGRLYPVNGQSPRIITPETPNAAAVFAFNTAVGWCHWNEQGLGAAHKALSTPLVNSLDDPRTTDLNDGNGGFLREDARLAVVFVTDEEDFSGEPVAFYETFFRAVKGNDPSLLSISAIAGPADLSTCPTASSTGTRYIALARATGGTVESICTQDWASSLANLSRTSFGARRHFRLTELPADPAQLRVTVDGAVVTTGWTYDGATNAVVFVEDRTPTAGAVVEITYRVKC